MKNQDGVDPKGGEGVKTPDATPPLVAIYGTVQRPSFWGKPKDGKDAAASSGDAAGASATPASKGAASGKHASKPAAPKPKGTGA